MSKLKKEQEKPKTSLTIESICALPFDKNLYMILFPRDVDIPKYDKYDGKKDPHNHIRQFYALSMDFMHDNTYLMQSFPRSLNGQAMEWFTKITLPLKSFVELVK